MKTLSDALFAKKHGQLTFGALIQVWQRDYELGCTQWRTAHKQRGVYSS